MSETFNAALIFGRIRLTPYDWVQDETGRWGERYERIDYDGEGYITARRILEPVCWLSVQ